MKYQNLIDNATKIDLILKDENFNSKDFKKFSKIISCKNNINLIYNFLIELLNVEGNNLIFDLNIIKVKKLLSIFVLIYYPEINNVSSKNETFQDLIKSCKLVQFSFVMLVKFSTNKLKIKDIEEKESFRNGFLPSINSFFNKLHNYLELFDSWKRIDLEHILFNLTYDYYNLEKKIQEKKKDFLFIEIKHIFILEQKKIKNHIRDLDSLNGMFKFNEYYDLILDYETENGEIENKEKIFALKVSKVMNKNLKKAYWDLLEDEFDLSNFAKLEKSIYELKELIKSCVPNKKDVHLELNEFLDEKFIIQKLEKKVFSISELSKLFEYILNKLECYQSEYEDEFTIKFREELNELIKNDLYSVGFIIRFFLEWIFPKFNNIVQFKEYLETQIQKN